MTSQTCDDEDSHTVLATEIADLAHIVAEGQDHIQGGISTISDNITQIIDDLNSLKIDLA